MNGFHGPTREHREWGSRQGTRHGFGMYIRPPGTEKEHLQSCRVFGVWVWDTTGKVATGDGRARPGVTNDNHMDERRGTLSERWTSDTEMAP